MITRMVVMAYVFFAAAAHAESVNVETLRELPDVRFPAENRIVSGAIDAADVERLHRAGIRHVVNLRPSEENPSFDEPRLVRAQGLSYRSIPIHGTQSLTKENAIELDRVLKEIGNEPALVHCSSGNRVGALIALREAWISGRPTEDAIAEGRRWGLTRLEGAVRTLLERRH